MRASLVLAASLALVVVACGRSDGAPKTTITTSGELAIGKAAPDFTAIAHDGFEVKPSALKGKPVVLYFYPRDETPGCTKEACSFRDAWKELEKTGVVMVGISTDSLDSHKSFAKDHQLPFHLISDPDGSIAKAYGVGKGFFGLDRHTIVIDAEGNVKKIYRSVDVTKHASEIMADLKIVKDLSVLVDGKALPENEARSLWARFSEWMEEHHGDLGGFAAKEGYASVHPGVEAGRPVLRASKTAPQRPYR